MKSRLEHLEKRLVRRRRGRRLVVEYVDGDQRWVGYDSGPEEAPIGLRVVVEYVDCSLPLPDTDRGRNPALGLPREEDLEG
jgi:hypothetical protein